MSKTQYPVQEIAPGCFSVDEFGLDRMYVVIGTTRALVIDAGTGAADFQSLVETLTDLPYDVAATHGHGDHIGGAGQFGRIYLHPADFPMAEEVRFAFRKGYCESMIRQYPALVDSIDVADMVDYPSPALLPLAEGDSFDLGGRVVHVHEAPGHTPGSVIFIDSQSKLIFSGDAYNPIFLLVMPGEDRMAVVRMFHAHAKALLDRKQREGLGSFYSGHDSPLPDAVLPDLCACCEGILTGSLQAEDTEVHIFKGKFYNHGMAHIVCDMRDLEIR